MHGSHGNRALVLGIVNIQRSFVGIGNIFLRMYHRYVKNHVGRLGKSDMMHVSPQFEMPAIARVAHQRYGRREHPVGVDEARYELGRMTSLDVVEKTSHHVINKLPIRLLVIAGLKSQHRVPDRDGEIVGHGAPSAITKILGRP